MKAKPKPISRRVRKRHPVEEEEDNFHEESKSEEQEASEPEEQPHKQSVEERLDRIESTLERHGIKVG